MTIILDFLNDDPLRFYFIDDYTDNAEYQKEKVSKNFWRIFAYDLECEEMNESGSGIFSIEDGLLWRDR